MVMPGRVGEEVGKGREGKVVVVIVIALPTMRIGHAFEWKIDLLVIVIELNLKFNKLYKRKSPGAGAVPRRRLSSRGRDRDSRNETTTDAKRVNCQFSDKQKPLTRLGLAWGRQAVNAF